MNGLGAPPIRDGDLRELAGLRAWHLITRRFRPDSGSWRVQR